MIRWESSLRRAHARSRTATQAHAWTHLTILASKALDPLQDTWRKTNSHLQYVLAWYLLCCPRVQVRRSPRQRAFFNWFVMTLWKHNQQRKATYLLSQVYSVQTPVFKRHNTNKTRVNAKGVAPMPRGLAYDMTYMLERKTKVQKTKTGRIFFFSIGSQYSI